MKMDHNSPAPCGKTVFTTSKEGLKWEVEKKVKWLNDGFYSIALG